MKFMWILIVAGALFISMSSLVNNALSVQCAVKNQGRMKKVDSGETTAVSVLEYRQACEDAATIWNRSAATARNAFFGSAALCVVGVVGFLISGRRGQKAAKDRLL